MIESTLALAAGYMHGVLHGADGKFHGVSTDTRKLAAGELFVALQGPNFDGAAFLQSAAAKQAAAAVVQELGETDLPQIAVQDTRLGLGELAAAWRRSLDTTVIGITGSNGKTTLKELIASCLGNIGPTLATAGNFNNEIGLPLMLLRLSAEHRYGVLEMGASRAGDIAYLANLAAAEVAVISNAGPAHLEGFGSIEGVARAKGELLTALAEHSHAILNADDAFFSLWQELAAHTRMVSFGSGPHADVYSSQVSSVADGTRFMLHVGDASAVVRLPLAGVHNVQNACAAAAVCKVLGVALADICHGLETVQPVAGRIRQLQGPGGARLYDDSYNANPASVIAAAKFLASLPGSSWLVLGDMGELGSDERELHRQVGAAAKRAGVANLLAVGELAREYVDAFGAGGQWFDSRQAAAEFLTPRLAAGDNVLVKGSRFMAMEKLVAALSSDASQAGDA